MAYHPYHFVGEVLLHPVYSHWLERNWQRTCSFHPFENYRKKNSPVHVGQWFLNFFHLVPLETFFHWNLHAQNFCTYFELCMTISRGWRLIGISGSLIWSKPWWNWGFNPCGEFRWTPEGPVSQIHSLHLLVGAPEISSDILKSVQMLKREWGAESNGKLPHLLNP